MKCELKLTEQQARVIIQALEFWSRMFLGQVEEIKWHPAVQDRKKSMALDSLVRQLKLSIFPELSPHGYFGIHSDKVPDQARQAFDILQVLRHQLWLSEGRQPRYAVDADEPTRLSEDESLPRIKELKE